MEFFLNIRFRHEDCFPETGGRPSEPSAPLRRKKQKLRGPSTPLGIQPGAKLEFYVRKDWRRERDSNPRYPLRYVRFRGGSFQPLTHLSGKAVVSGQWVVASDPVNRDPYIRDPSINDGF